MPFENLYVTEWQKCCEMETMSLAFEFNLILKSFTA